MAKKHDSTALAQVAQTALAKPDYGIDVGRVVAMRAAVVEVVTKVLHEGEHFGVLPGTTGRDGKPPKKMLFQPGAEVLCQVFRLRPQFEVVTREERAGSARIINTKRKDSNEEDSNSNESD